MRRGGLDLPPMGGEGKVVEADETYVGDIPESERRAFKTTGRPYSKRGGGSKHKRAIIALIERGGEGNRLTYHQPR